MAKGGHKCIQFTLSPVAEMLICKGIPGGRREQVNSRSVSGSEWGFLTTSLLLSRCHAQSQLPILDCIITICTAVLSPFNTGWSFFSLRSQSLEIPPFLAKVTLVSICCICILRQIKRCKVDPSASIQLSKVIPAVNPSLLCITGAEDVFVITDLHSLPCKQIALHHLAHWLIQRCSTAGKPACQTTWDLMYKHASCPGHRPQELPAIKHHSKLSSTKMVLETEEILPTSKCTHSV